MSAGLALCVGLGLWTFKPWTYLSNESRSRALAGVVDYRFRQGDLVVNVVNDWHPGEEDLARIREFATAHRRDRITIIDARGAQRLQTSPENLTVQALQ